jgi:hypothetical protein
MNRRLEAKAREMDPEFWASWDASPEHMKTLPDYHAMVIRLHNARRALGLPAGTDVLIDSKEDEVA